MIDNVYIAEAFKELQLLEEEDFKLGKEDTFEDMKSFLDTEDNLDNEVDIIDIDAEYKEDLKDSYIGKVVVDCTVCHSKIYRDLKDIVIDEDDETLVNVGDECPYCTSTDGYTIIGQIAPFKPEDDVKITVEPKEGSEDTSELKIDTDGDGDTDITVEVEDDKEEMDESFKSETNKFDVQKIEDPKEDDLHSTKPVVECGTVEESINRPTREDNKEDFDNYEGESKVIIEAMLDSDDLIGLEGKSIKVLEDIYYCDLDNWYDPEDIPEYMELRGDDLYIPAGTVLTCNGKSGSGWPSLGPDDLDFALESPIKASILVESFKEITNQFKTQKIEDPEEDDLHSDKPVVECNKSIKEGLMTYEEVWGQTDEDPFEVAKEFNLRVEKIDCHGDECTYRFSGSPKSFNKAREAGFFYSMDYENESFNEEWIHINANAGEGTVAKAIKVLKDAGIKVDSSTEDRNMGVYHKSQVRGIPESLKESSNWEKIAKKLGIEENLHESIEKVDLETEHDVIHIQTEEKEVVEGEEMIAPISDAALDEIQANSEEALEEEPVEEEPEEDFVDTDIDDFDEESFDDVVESYLKEAYGNVTSFKTRSITDNNNKLVIEGLIKFESGNSKKTSFIFEAADLTKSGKARFIGENKEISRGKKSFKLNGTLHEGKFITESLNYNYRAKDAEGNSQRVYGTSKKRG